MTKHLFYLIFLIPYVMGCWIINFLVDMDLHNRYERFYHWGCE